MKSYIYLIIPPIIIILGIAGMIYLIAKHSLDIEKKKKESKDENLQKRTLKEKVSGLFLRFLERFTRWFKIFSLRLHNVTEGWLSRISQKRKKYIDKQKKESIKIVAKKKPRKKLFKFWKKKKEKNINNKDKENLLSLEKKENNNENSEKEKQAEYVNKKREHKKRFFSKKSFSKVFSKNVVLKTEEKKTNQSKTDNKQINHSIDINKSMISPRVVRPEKKREKNELEKILIERIAMNPKDIEAYERLGNYYEEIEEWNDAEACYAQVLKLSVKNYRIEMRLERVQRIIRKLRY